MLNQGHPDTQARFARGLKSLAFAFVATLACLAPSAHADKPATDKPASPSQSGSPLVGQAAQTLGEAAISNQVLRIVLRSQAQISLYNARGQMLYQGESPRGVATLPLKSIDFGFLFLTLRQGQAEQTIRLLHNGK